jgi:excisionase family DNA binding protein
MKDAIVVMTGEQLHNLISAAVEEGIQKAGAIGEATPPDILNCVQVATLIGVHPDTVPRLTRKKNGLPVFGRAGSHLRFRRADVLHWLASGRDHA